MSIHSSLRFLTIFAMSLATTSVAFARNPPALVRAQQADGPAVATSGYRDSLARLGKREVGIASAGPGYRDAFGRFASQKPLRVASRR